MFKIKAFLDLFRRKKPQIAPTKTEADEYWETERRPRSEFLVKNKPK